MPRSTSRNRSAKPTVRPMNRQPSNARTATPPAPASQPAQQGSTFGDAVKSGIGLGVGMEAVRAVTGSLTNKEPLPSHNPCVSKHDELITCLTNQQFDCQGILLDYKECLAKHRSV